MALHGRISIKQHRSTLLRTGQLELINDLIASLPYFSSADIKALQEGKLIGNAELSAKVITLAQTVLKLYKQIKLFEMIQPAATDDFATKAKEDTGISNLLHAMIKFPALLSHRKSINALNELITGPKKLLTVDDKIAEAVGAFAMALNTLTDKATRATLKEEKVTIKAHTYPTLSKYLEAMREKPSQTTTSFSALMDCVSSSCTKALDYFR